MKQHIKNCSILHITGCLKLLMNDLKWERADPVPAFPLTTYASLHHDYLENKLIFLIRVL